MASVCFQRRWKTTCLEHFAKYPLTVCDHVFVHIVSVLCYTLSIGETCLWFISIFYFYLFFFILGKVSCGDDQLVLKVFTSFKCVVPSTTQENYSNWSLHVEPGQV